MAHPISSGRAIRPAGIRCRPRCPISLTVKPVRRGVSVLPGATAFARTRSWEAAAAGHVAAYRLASQKR